MNHLITWMIFTPIAGALLLSTIPLKIVGGRIIIQRGFFIFSLCSSILGALVSFSMLPGVSDLQFLDSHPWISSFSIMYEVGIDGVSVFPVLLISVLFPVLTLSEWGLEKGYRGMGGLLLLIQGALLGAVTSNDLFLMFFFLGVLPIPVYFLIAAWGNEDSGSAGFHYVVYTIIGLSLFLASAILMYAGTDIASFSLKELSGEKLINAKLTFFGSELSVGHIAFTLVAIGLGLQAPVWPFHGWYLRVAESSRPTVIALLTGAITPVLFFIFIRLSYLLFPLSVGKYASVIISVGLLNMLVPAVSVLSQTKLRSVISNIHLSLGGLILIGIGSLSASGLIGSLFHLASTAGAVSAIIIMIGIMEERFKLSDTAVFDQNQNQGGLVWRAPVLGAVCAVFFVSLIGFPGVGGFIGTALLLMGSFNVHPLMVLVCSGAILFSAFKVFSVFRTVFLGKADGDVLPKGSDLTLREKFYVAPLVLGLLVLGLYPKVLLELIRPTALTLLSMVK